ncbi:hypothetical protein GF377_05845, partial [candidate division GN15 bacterium]|nr:hypothetical protein [candidate division GN15 bacterium]
MSSRAPAFLQPTLSWLFSVFVFASAFSIALAQTSLGLSLMCFLPIVIFEKHLPWRRPLLWFYRLVGAYVVWLAISSVIGPTPLASLAALREEWLFAIIPVAVYVLRDSHSRDRVLIALAAGVAFSSVYALTQLIAGYDWLLGHNMHTMGGQG